MLHHFLTFDGICCWTLALENKRCNYEEFRCENGPCLRKELHCDGKVDCPLDISDELDCEHYVTEPNYSKGVTHLAKWHATDKLDIY